MCHKIVISLDRRVKERLHILGGGLLSIHRRLLKQALLQAPCPENAQNASTQKAGVSDFQRSRQMTQSVKSPTPKRSSAGNKAPAVAFLRLHGA